MLDTSEPSMLASQTEREYAPSLSRFHFSMFFVTFCWFVPVCGRYGMEWYGMHTVSVSGQASRTGAWYTAGTRHAGGRVSPGPPLTEDVKHVDSSVLAGHVQHRDVEVDADLCARGGVDGHLWRSTPA